MATINSMPIRGLGFRYITLDACGNIIATSKEHAGKKWTKVEYKPNVYEGEEIELFQADGQVALTDTPTAYAKYDNLTWTLLGRQPKLVSALTGAPTLVKSGGSAHVIGYAEPTAATTAPNGGSLEIWQKNGGVSGCDSDATAVFPYQVTVWGWTKNWADKTGSSVESAAKPEYVFEGRGFRNTPMFAGLTITAATTSASTAVTVASTANLHVGQTVVGTGIPALATIASITDATHFALSAAATATGAAVALTISSGGPHAKYGLGALTQVPDSHRFYMATTDAPPADADAASYVH